VYRVLCWFSRTILFGVINRLIASCFMHLWQAGRNETNSNMKLIQYNLKRELGKWFEINLDIMKLYACEIYLLFSKLEKRFWVWVKRIWYISSHAHKLSICWYWMKLNSIWFGCLNLLTWDTGFSSQYLPYRNRFSRLSHESSFELKLDVLENKYR